MKALRFCSTAILLMLFASGCGSSNSGGAGTSTTPTANAGPDQSVTTGSLVALNGSGSTDPNGDTLTYAWSITSQPGGSSATLSSPAAVNPTFTPDVDGTYVVQLVVNDGTADSAPDAVTVTATAAGGNAAPVADAGPNQNVNTGSLVTLDGSSSSDADAGDTLTYSWSITTQPGTATLSSATGANPTFTPDVDGTYVIQLMVNDGTVDSAPDSVTITASTANSAPVATAGPDQSVTTGSLVTLDGSGSSDADAGDTLTYSWSITSQPGTATLSSTTASNPTFTPDTDGTYVIQLIVNDGTVDSTPDTVTVTATAPAPGASISLPQTGQTLCYDASGAEITCAGTGQDADMLKGTAWPGSRFTAGTGAETDCVIDNLTGLMWAKTPDNTLRNWQQSLDHANGLSLCGHDDWRLPNKNELLSLVNFAEGDHAAWLNSQGFSGVQATAYRTSTTSAYSTQYAMAVDFSNGNVGETWKGGWGYTWTVRAGAGEYTAAAELPETGQTSCWDMSGASTGCAGTGQDGDVGAGAAWPASRFTPGTGAEADCITDNLTGLMWPKSSNTSSWKSWQLALDYANGFSLCGHDDWRLPNILELNSLINDEQSNPSAWLTAQGFTMSGIYFWASTTSATSKTLAWGVNVDNGTTTAGVKTNAFGGIAWPVRGGQ